MGEYSLKLGEAVLRSRTREAETNARLEAEVAAKIKSEFISNMSHELRTPLNTVIGFSKLLTEHDQRPLGNDEIIEYAQLIQDAAGNLLAIINNILDMSKLQSGQFRLEPADVHLDEIMEALAFSLKGLAKDSSIEFAVELPDEAVVVKGDGGKLRQAISNLINNAIKFTGPGGRVDVSVANEADGAVVVRITDTGVGMDGEQLEVAMAPFGQVDGARTRWREGAGLGLPIAKALIEMHGGGLEITSQVSQGTQVIVRLPPPDFVAFMQSNIGIRVGKA